MLIGVLCGLLTGALWGLTFVGPRAVAPFTELDLAVMRYCVFGLASALLMLADRRFRPGKLTVARIVMALVLGGAGYVFYFLFATLSVRFAGPAIAPLVIGLLPVLLAIIGNWSDNSVPWRRLAIPLVVIGVGVGIVNAATLSRAATSGETTNVVIGIALAVCALLIWIVYAVINARAMRAADAPGALAWTSLQGLGAAAVSLTLIPIAMLTGASALGTVPLTGPEGLTFLAWSIGLGLAGGWLATWTWSVTSQRLPLALSAQLIVSETIFALIYGFWFAGIWPTPVEWIGALMQLTGVVAAVAIFSMRPSVASDRAAKG